MTNRSRGESVSFGSAVTRREPVKRRVACRFVANWPLLCVRPVIPQKSDAGENKSSLALVQAFSRPHRFLYVNFCALGGSSSPGTTQLSPYGRIVRWLPLNSTLRVLHSLKTARTLYRRICTKNLFLRTAVCLFACVRWQCKTPLGCRFTQFVLLRCGSLD
jgi:hypothetical protein